MEKEKLEKKKKKEPIKPIILVPEVDREDHAVFRCINKEDAELLTTGLSSKRVIVKSAKENTCPLEPDTPYDKSICKVINDLFKKDKKRKKRNDKEN